MIEAIGRQDRRLRISHAEILKHASAPDRSLAERIDRYIDIFCGLRGLSEQVFCGNTTGLSPAIPTT